MLNASKYLSVLTLIVLLTSCATTRYVLYEKTERQSRPVDYKVDLYYAAGAPHLLQVIGSVIVSNGPFHHVMDAIEHLQDEAGKMGGDAMIDLAPGLPNGDPMPKGGWFIFGGFGEI